MFRAAYSYKPDKEFDTDIQLKPGDIVTNVEYLGKYHITSSRIC